MRTITLMLTSALLATCLTTSAQAKKAVKQADEEIILMPHPEYVSELLNEVNVMNTKIARLRLQAGKMQGADKTVLNDEADALVRITRLGVRQHRILRCFEVNHIVVQ